MRSNIGSQVQDTTSGFLTLVDNWLNDKYLDAWRRVPYSAIIDDDNTFESIVNQPLYDLPVDFEEEIFLANIAQGEILSRSTIGNWWTVRARAHQNDSILSGTPLRYVILEETKISSGVRRKQLKLDPPPSVAETYALPYKKSFKKLLTTSGTCSTDTASKVIDSTASFITDGVEVGMIINNTTDNTFGLVLTVDSETQITAGSDVCPDGNEAYTVGNFTTIPDIEPIIELGAIAEAWAYKRQFAKSNFYLNRYEVELRRRSGQERKKLNQLYQFVSRSFNTPSSRRFLLGDQSYNDL